MSNQSQKTARVRALVIFGKNGIWNADLTDVVKPRRHPEQTSLLRGPAQRQGNQGGRAANPPRVLARGVIPVLGGHG